MIGVGKLSCKEPIFHWLHISGALVFLKNYRFYYQFCCGCFREPDLVLFWPFNFLYCFASTDQRQYSDYDELINCDWQIRSISIKSSNIYNSCTNPNCKHDVLYFSSVILRHSFRKKAHIKKWQSLSKNCTYFHSLLNNYWMIPKHNCSSRKKKTLKSFYYKTC